MVREYRLEPTGANIPDMRIEDALNLGWYYLNAGHLDNAHVTFDAILRHGYYHEIDAMYLMGSILHYRGDFEVASHCYRECLRFQPGYSDGRAERLLDMAMAGERGPAVPVHDWPWVCKDFTSYLYQKPFWGGCTPLDGRTVLLHDDGIGLGDTIQCVRYAIDVKGHGAGSVIMECERNLAGFLATCPGIDKVVPRGDPIPDFDVHSRIWGLMGVFGLIDNVPYLSADPDRLERWRRRLDDVPDFRVGICWNVLPANPLDRHRSVPLASFESLSRIPGVRLVSLQKGFGVEQLEGCPFPVVNFGDDFDSGLSSYVDTPAIMANLDLVIAVDTSVAHAAGALGIPVWIPLTMAKDWRWDIGPEDTTPWYPTATLFRQREPGDWAGVLARMAEKLARQAR